MTRKSIPLQVSGGWSHTTRNNERFFNVRAEDPVSGVQVWELEIPDVIMLDLLSNHHPGVDSATSAWEFSESAYKLIGCTQERRTVNVVLSRGVDAAGDFAEHVAAALKEQGHSTDGWTASEYNRQLNHHRWNKDGTFSVPQFRYIRPDGSIVGLDEDEDDS